MKFLLFALFWAWSLAAYAALPSVVDGQPLPSLAPMLERTTPAVVNIATRGKVRRRIELPLPNDPIFRRFFDLPELERVQETSSLGSGVIVDAAAGLVLTNFHVIKDAYQIKITLTDGRELDAEIVGRDPDTDIAVLRVPADGLSDLPLADSSRLRVGDFVVAIGNPFGLGQTVTSGIVSALGRSGLGVKSFEDFIQTDASINIGNSGGALVNLRGELVGINTAIYGAGGQGSIGIGFAIPINLARYVMRELVEFGEVRRGRLGARGQDLTERLAQAFGIAHKAGFVITQIESGSPAAKAGLAIGDIVIAANGRPIRSARDVHNLVGLQRLGQTIELELYRDGEILQLPVLIQPTDVRKLDGARLHPRLAGAIIGEMREQHLQRGRVDYLEVLEVARASSAAEAGLQAGDIIFSLNKQRARNFDEAFAIVEQRERGLILTIQRDNRELYLLLR